MIRKIQSILLPVFLVIIISDWVVGVKKVNSESYVPTVYIEMDEPFYMGDVCMTAKELKLYTNEEFAEEFGVDYGQTVYAGDMIIVLEFSVKNTSDGEMNMSKLLENTGLGFETHTWYSNTDPFLCREINLYDSETIQSGEEIRVYTAVGINKSSFSDEGWESLYDTVFYYTMSMYPEPVKIRLGIPERISDK